MLRKIVIEELSSSSDEEHMDISEDNGLIVSRTHAKNFEDCTLFMYESPRDFWDSLIFQAEQPTRKMGSLGPKLGRFINEAREVYINQYRNNLNDFIRELDNYTYLNQLVINARKNKSKTDYIHNGRELSIIIYAYTYNIPNYYPLTKYTQIVQDFFRQTGKDTIDEDDGLLYLLWYKTNALSRENY